jgi:hypothetical protein
LKSIVGIAERGALRGAATLEFRQPDIRKRFEAVIQAIGAQEYLDLTIGSGSRRFGDCSRSISSRRAQQQSVLLRQARRRNFLFLSLELFASSVCGRSTHQFGRKGFGLRHSAVGGSARAELLAANRKPAQPIIKISHFLADIFFIPLIRCLLLKPQRD